MLLLQKTEKKRPDGTTVISSFHNGAHANNARPKSAESDSDIHKTAANLTSWWGQQIPFNAIVSAGALVKNSDGTYGQGGGFTMGNYYIISVKMFSFLISVCISPAWDNCSDTPVSRYLIL